MYFHTKSILSLRERWSYQMLKKESDKVARSCRRQFVEIHRKLVWDVTAVPAHLSTKWSSWRLQAFVSLTLRVCPMAPPCSQQTRSNSQKLSAIEWSQNSRPSYLQHTPHLITKPCGADVINSSMRWTWICKTFKTYNYQRGQPVEKLKQAAMFRNGCSKWWSMKELNRDSKSATSRSFTARRTVMISRSMDEISSHLLLIMCLCYQYI